MKTNNLSREYKIDYINEKIIISKKFMKAAGVFNSPEYTLMKELRADYPTFALEAKEITKKAGKNAHKNLTFEKMREHIILRDGEDSDRLKRYDYLMEFYKTHSGRYAKIKSWYSWVFSLGKRIRIAAPQEAIDGMKKLLTDVASRYEG